MNQERIDTWIHRIFLMNSLIIVLPFYINVPVFIISIIFLFWHKRYQLKHVIKDAPYMFMFIMYCLAVALWRQNFIGAAVVPAFLMYYGYFYFYGHWIQATTYLKIIHFHVIASGFLGVSAILIYMHYALTHGYGLLYIFKYNNLQTRAEATFFNANYYGLYCLVVVVMLLYLIMKVKVRKMRILYYLLLLINIIAIILTASRWMWPSVLFVVGVFFLMLNLSWIKYIGGLLLLVIGVLFAKPNLLPRVESLAYAFEDRWSLWSTGWSLFMWRPWFGTGPMTYMSYYYLFSDNGNMHAHNILVDILANYGVVGALLLCLVIYKGVKPYFSLIHNHQCRLEIVFLIAVALAILFHGIMDVAVFWVQTGYVVLMLMLLKQDKVIELGQVSIQSMTDVRKQLYLTKKDMYL